MYDIAQFGDPRLPHRFWVKCMPEPNSGCWLWFAAATERGYGVLSVGRGVVRTHRLAYTSLVGPVPIGREIDHLCRVTACCNPAHLEPVTHRENLRRGHGSAAARKRHRSKTHCPHGHPYNASHTMVRPRGECRECSRLRCIEYRRKS